MHYTHAFACRELLEAYYLENTRFSITAYVTIIFTFFNLPNELNCKVYARKYLSWFTSGCIVCYPLTIESVHIQIVNFRHLFIDKRR